MASSLPMGMGNNNPLNIKYYKGAPYAGLVGPSQNTDQGDPQMVFDTPQSGWNAAHSLLSSKYAGGKRTPNQIIAERGGWTPGNYQAAANVARSAGIGPNDDIQFTDPVRAQAFMRALVTQEQGTAANVYPASMIAAATGGPVADPAHLQALRARGTTLTSTPPAATVVSRGTPAAPVALVPPAPKLSPYQMLQKGDVQGALTAVTANKTDPKTGQEQPGTSSVDKLASAFQPQQQAQQQVQSPPMLQPQDSSAAMIGPSQQLLAQILASSAKPLTWSSRPYGSGAGLQVPGATLNTTGGLYNG